MRDYYEDDLKEEQHASWRAHEQELGCSYCYDNHTKKNIEIYFFDRANNMRISTYCPSCGRKII